MKEYCSACERIAMVEGHCSFCGHQLKTIPWRSVWEIADKFLPGRAHLARLPSRTLGQKAFQRRISERAHWLQQRLREQVTPDQHGLYALELEQIKTWYQGRGWWKELASQLHMPSESSGRMGMAWPAKLNKIWALLILIAAVLFAPAIGQELFNFLVVKNLN